MTATETAENKRIVREMIETVINDHQFQRVDDYFTEDILIKGAGSTFEGIEEWRGFLRELDTTFPDFAFSLEDMIAAGPKVAIHITVSGTHEGPFEGIPATGEEFSYPAVMIITLDEGKISKIVYESDRVGLLEQLGVMDP